MWNRKCKIIQVISGATEIVTEGLRKNLVSVPGKHLLDLQQITKLKT